jgi:hypothetical protein
MSILTAVAARTIVDETMEFLHKALISKDEKTRHAIRMKTEVNARIAMIAACIQLEANKQTINVYLDDFMKFYPDLDYNPADEVISHLNHELSVSKLFHFHQEVFGEFLRLGYKVELTYISNYETRIFYYVPMISWGHAVPT